MTVRWQSGLAGLLVLVGAALRFWRLGQRSFWFDESLAIYRGLSADLAGVLSAPPQVEPPLYYALLHFWLVQGADETTARAFSALMSSVALLLAWLVLKRLLPPPQALAALALFAFSPFQVLYAQEARPYGLRLLFEYAGLLTLLVAVRHRTFTAWAGWALLGALGALTHYLSLLWLACQWIFLLLAGAGRKVLVRAAAFGVLAAAPALLLAASAREAITLVNTAVPRLIPPLDVAGGAVQLFGAGAWVPGPLAHPAFVLFAVFGLLGVCVAGLSWRRRVRLRLSSAAILALGVLMLILLVAGHWAGLVYRPKLRYGITAQLFLLVACVRGIWTMPRGLVRMLALSALLLIEGFALANYFRGGFPPLDLPPCKKPFREAAGLLLAKAQAGDYVLSPGLVSYLPLKLQLGERLPQGYHYREDSFLPTELDRLGHPAPLGQVFRRARRIWLVLAPVHYTDPLTAPRELVKALRTKATLVETHAVPGIGIQLWRVHAP